MKILNCKAVSILICKKKFSQTLPGVRPLILIPHLLRLEPSFGRNSVTNPQTDKPTDSRIIYNRSLELRFTLTVTPLLIRIIF